MDRAGEAAWGEDMGRKRNDNREDLGSSEAEAPGAVGEWSKMAAGGGLSHSNLPHKGESIEDVNMVMTGSIH